MPYDPQWPQNGFDVDANRFREQFQGIIDLINSAPGGGITAAEVDAVVTLPPGSSATVAVSLTGTVLHFSFGLPQGEAGPPGDAGPAGEVTAQQLADAVETRAHAVHGVDPLALTAEAEYSPTQVQDIANKVDEILNVMKGS